MKLTRWLPWNFILKWAARRYDFLDPVTVMARIRQFGQPSEVMEPIELLRAGLVFHARGVVNTRAIQYNLDWIWPFWVVKQFSPSDLSFIPRGFSFSHINVTHRNWTMVGQPDLAIYPIVDPRGLVTPFYDSWSVDAWVLTESGTLLAPSQSENTEQTLNLKKNLKVRTRTQMDGGSVFSTVQVAYDLLHNPYLEITAEGLLEKENGWLLIAIRPYNPEGISFIDHLSYHVDEKRLQINQDTDLFFSVSPEKVLLNAYRDSDIAHNLDRADSDTQIHCPIGMATAAAFFPLDSGQQSGVSCRIRLDPAEAQTALPDRTQDRSLEMMTSRTAQLEIPDKKFSFLYDAAVSTMLLLTAQEPFPGPYTYRRFWFRDACLMINALLGLGLSERSYRHIMNFPNRQTFSGYFLSQEGEWDSNGQVLWLANRYFQLTGQTPEADLAASLKKGACWIRDKIRQKADGERHDGLLPAGFSAEHLGPNDYYYWDDFWACSGLEAAASMAMQAGENTDHQEFKKAADQLHTRIFKSMQASPGHQKYGAIPASCYRRMDAGAIGSLVADYPLQITQPGHDAVMKTVEYLLENCFVNHAFFQDMIHSGLNAYLTLDIAQTLLRNNDTRYQKLIRVVANLASPTGQWPEAIHPTTGGGCMGDGQHGWAAAEWIMMMRNLFVREEGKTLVIGAGIFPDWIEEKTRLAFGPTLVPGGQLKVRITGSANRLTVFLDSDFHGPPLPCRIAVPGYRPVETDTSESTHVLEPIREK